MQISLIANPSAGSGRASGRLQALSRAFEQHGFSYRVLATESRGHATVLAREVVTQTQGEEGHILAVLGGDGTLNEVCQAYLNSAGEAVTGPPLALLPSGTGGDTARTLQLPENPRALIEVLKANEPRPMDLGRIEVRSDAGSPQYRAFINVCTAGLGPAVARRVNRVPKRLGGAGAFYFGTVLGALSYRNLAMNIAVDGEIWHRGPVLVVAIGNGKYIGGGMKITPDAEMDDGEFDIVCIGDVSSAKLLMNLKGVRKGDHLSRPGVTSTRGRVVEITPARAMEAPIDIEADGETLGTTPLQARVLPNALRMFTGVS